MNRLVLRLLGLILVIWVPGALAVNVLVGNNPPSVVYPKEYLNISSQYYLVMQPDCNLILYNSSGQPLRNTNSSTQSLTRNCTLQMQADGNLVIYNSTVALWDQRNYSAEGNRSFLLVGGNGSLDYYNYDTKRREINFNGYDTSAEITYPEFNPNTSEYKPWKPTASLDEFPYMPAEYFLSAGKRLLTMNSRFYLTLGNDCNLQSREIFYGKTEEFLWGSGTSNNRTCELTLLLNGLLEIRDTNSREVYWNSTNAGGTSVSWILKLNPDNGELSVSDITNSSDILWRNEAVSVPPNDQANSDRPVVWIVVGVIGGAFVLAMAALGFCFYARRNFIDPAEKAFQMQMRANGGNSQAFSQGKIKQATKNYGNMIGHGGFGEVFYGKLPDGREVAAKVLSANSHQSKQEFYNEVELLSKVHRKYLVSLLGYSCARTQQVLIYEYMGGGDLRHRLQGESGAGNPLSWQQRTDIILQVAEGLEYLHDKCTPPIIHRDIKSSNILLTNKLVAKVADFGLSKLKIIGQEDATHITTVVKGTPGYLDPEYHETGLLTEKSDVYAFGVVLMEILTGRHHMHIAQRVGDAWRQEQVDGLADPNLGEDFKRDELVNLVELSLWCVRRSSLERPFMRQIVRRLHELLLVPSEASHPEFEFDEERQRNAMNIELLLDSENFTSETAPLSESSSNDMSFEAPQHGPHLRIRSPRVR